MAFCNSCGAEMQPTIPMCPGCGSISGLIGGISPSAVPGTPPPTAVRTRGPNTKARVLAVVCITVSSVFAANMPLRLAADLVPLPFFQQLSRDDPGDLRVDVFLTFMVVVCLFSSVRWHMKLSGRTHQVDSQAWAAIFFWYSLLGIVYGLIIILPGFFGRGAFGAPRIGEGVVAIFTLVGFPSGIWREQLRAAEKTIQASARADAV